LPILAVVEAGLGGWERYQARIGVARNFSSRVAIGTTQNRWVALGSLARARPIQATDALIVNFARQQWGDLAGSPCEMVAAHLYPGIEFRPNEIGLAAKARLSDDLLQNPRLNRQRSRAAITTHIESRKRK